MGDVIKLRPNNTLSGGNADTAELLRELARQIDEGDWGDVVRTVTVIEYDTGKVGRYTTATEPTDRARVAGLLFIGAQRVTD